MPRKKQAWGEGDNFLVPLQDGRFVQAQIVRVADDAMKSVVCAFSSAVYEQNTAELQALNPEDTIAILFVTRDLLDNGRWKVHSNSYNSWGADYIGFATLQQHGFVGVKIIGSGNIESFLNAFHNLYPWDGFHNPDYLDSLLLRPDLRPKRTLLS